MSLSPVIALDSCGLHEFAAASAALSDAHLTTSLRCRNCRALRRGAQFHAVLWALSKFDAPGLSEQNSGPDKGPLCAGPARIARFWLAEGRLARRRAGLRVGRGKGADRSDGDAAASACHACDGGTPMLSTGAIGRVTSVPSSAILSAILTRWRIGCAPSARLLPGWAALVWSVELVRQRIGHPFSLSKLKRVMTRVASLYLPHLAIEGGYAGASAWAEWSRPSSPPDAIVSVRRVAIPRRGRRQSGACSVPRGGGWRPGALGAGSPGPRGEPWRSRVLFPHNGARPSASRTPERRRASSISRDTPDERKRGPAVNPSAHCLQWTRQLILIERVGQKEVFDATCSERWNWDWCLNGRRLLGLVADLATCATPGERDRDVLDFQLALHAVGRWTLDGQCLGPVGLGST